MTIYNDNWLGRKLHVIDSNDTTLIARQGMIVDETKNTITIQEDGRFVKLGKSSIKFTISDSDVVIDGTMVGQRPENRTHKKYRLA
tara:strand:- start:632 stop:889 length:258 start_codon:yes stop_codon:yes gene_type:complete